MIVVKDMGGYLDIYSSNQKKILEITNGKLWNATEESPISVDKERYVNGDYIESEEDVVIESEDELNEKFI